MVAAILGAVIGALANGWYREREVKALTKRERLGLLNLLSSEIEDNDSLLCLFMEHPMLIDPQTTAGLQTAAWDKAQVRLAQLLPEGHLDALVRYYSQLHVLKVAVDTNIREKIPEEHRLSDDKQLEEHKKRAKKSREAGQKARSLREKYLED